MIDEMKGPEKSSLIERLPLHVQEILGRLRESKEPWLDDKNMRRAFISEVWAGHSYQADRALARRIGIKPATLLRTVLRLGGIPNGSIEDTNRQLLNDIRTALILWEKEMRDQAPVEMTGIPELDAQNMAERIAGLPTDAWLLDTRQQNILLRTDADTCTVAGLLRELKVDEKSFRDVMGDVSGTEVTYQNFRPILKGVQEALLVLHSPDFNATQG